MSEEVVGGIAVLFCCDATSLVAITGGDYFNFSIYVSTATQVGMEEIKRYLLFTVYRGLIRPQCFKGRV